ncbi:isoprenylcysteine carboxylmethyltransferase family protein [Streptomyces sp. NPDC052535]|uniref:methyltransferase family protein n=1 Tax=Streptomyces sp. NPDC052535 TaxID=3155531 RepID=UPI0034459E1C
MNDSYGYGLWALVVFNTVLLVLFAASFFHPRNRRDWRVLGGFSAFAVALFTEMYGFPLTVYLLSGPLGGWFPNLGLSHAQGHLWNDLIGWQGDPHLSPFHLASYVLIVAGFALIYSGWRHLFAAQRAGRLARSGPYRHIRHPQYTGFLAIMVGFLLMWPTLPTLVMFPILVWIYRRLALREEAEVAARFGDAWTRYSAKTPRFVPSLRHRQPAAPRTGQAADRTSNPGSTEAPGSLRTTTRSRTGSP